MRKRLLPPRAGVRSLALPPSARPARLLLAALALALAAAALAVPLRARGANARAGTVRQVLPAAVRIQVTAAGEVVRTASGVTFAAEAGRSYVLTNAHVVEGAKGWKGPVAVRVLPASGAAALPARVLARGRAPEQDLAVLEVDGALPAVALAADDALELGDDLVVIGAPFGKGLSVAAGIVSQVEYAFAENAAAPGVPRALKTDAAIGYGSSGAPVFDVPAGRLVGLVEGYRTARVAFGKEEEYAFDVPMPGETFVAPAAKIRAFLAERGLGRLAPAPLVAPAAAAPGGAPPAVPAAAF
jgi:S1-C subfamily serine protease